jgi:flagellar basal-body rod modification protein FlgD
MSPTPSVTSPSTSASSAAAAAAADANPLANEDTFLQLLVSQLQYQDPLSPVDSTQFVTQLTGYSQLEQLINIDKNTGPAAAAPATPAATSSTNSTQGI